MDAPGRSLFLSALLLFLPAFPTPAAAQDAGKGAGPDGLKKKIVERLRKLASLDEENLPLFMNTMEKVFKKITVKIEGGREATLESLVGMDLLWDALVETLEDPRLPWKEGHFLAASRFFNQKRDPKRSIRICKAGLKRFPESRFLLDNMGFAYIMQAKQAGKREEVNRAFRKAYLAFRKAVRRKPETFHAHLGLLQTAFYLGRFETAMKELEKLRASSDAPKDLLENLKPIEGRTRLGAGDFEGAAKILDDPDFWKDDPDEMILAMRARALEGKTGRALDLAEKMPGKGVDPRKARWARADLLIFLGRGKEAAHFLKKNPVKRKPGERENEFVLAKQAQAGLRFLSLLSPKTTGKIRRGLPKLLDHKCLLFVEEKGKPRQILLNRSPIAMASLVLGCPPSVKKGENTLLLAFLSLELQKHKPTSFEKKYVLPYKMFTQGTQKLGTPDGLLECIRKLKEGLPDPGFNCALTAWKFARYLETLL